ncbi:cysteine peptidase family C39 domain-containing protein [Salinarimonas chemoclinalis]|uniref:cysteine peptidase family C39 domain-containing protein n=1 Tax=Salinarimonas chemoclinalis TaxID=3241599 RepID=UPI003555EBB3
MSRLASRMRPILQMEAAECGAACLAMVLEAHGRVVGLEEAREACGTSRDGVDVTALVAAAGVYGLDVKPLAREPETLAELPLPAILHWRFNHFVVLERVTRAGYVLLDPALGRRVVDRAEMDRSFTGLVLALAPGERFETGGARPSLLATLAGHARGSGDGLWIVLACGLLGLVPAIALAGAIQVFTDHVVGEGRVAWTAAVLAALLVAALAQAGLGALRAWSVANLKAKIGTVVAAQGFRRMLTLPLAFFGQRNAGELVARLRIGSEIGGTVAGPLASLVPNVLTLLGLLALVALHDVVVGLVVAGVAAACLAVLTTLAQRIAEANRAQHVLDARAGGIGASGFAAFEAFRLTGREALFARRWMAAEEEALDAEQRLGRVRAIAALGPAATPLLLAIVVLVLGADRVMAGDMTLGALLALQVLAGLVAAPLAGLARDLCDLQEAAGALVRLEDLERHPADPLMAADAPARPAIVSGAPALALEGVGFAYGAHAPVFAGIRFDIAPGTLVALTGPSGSGKSTLARIAAGLVAPHAGRVLIAGVPLADVPRADLRRRLAYVPQTSAVFTGTLAENVALFDPAIADEAIVRALEIAGVDRLIARAGGLRAPLFAEAPPLSGGEVQRLALARALVRRPEILVLDETTSALDPVREGEVLDALRETGACVLCVTHRPGTRARCDRVIALDGRGGLSEVFERAAVPAAAAPEPTRASA